MYVSHELLNSTTEQIFYYMLTNWNVNKNLKQKKINMTKVVGKHFNRDHFMITCRREKSFIDEVIFSQYFEKKCNSFIDGKWLKTFLERGKGLKVR